MDTGGFGGQAGNDTLLAGAGLFTASPSLTYSRFTANHANISTSFHPYRRWCRIATFSIKFILFLLTFRLYIYMLIWPRLWSPDPVICYNVLFCSHSINCLMLDIFHCSFRPIHVWYYVLWFQCSTYLHVTLSFNLYMCFVWCWVFPPAHTRGISADSIPSDAILCCFVWFS